MCTPAVGQRSSSKSKAKASVEKQETHTATYYKLEDLELIASLSGFSSSRDDENYLKEKLLNEYRVSAGFEKRAWIDTLDGIEMVYTRHSFSVDTRTHGFRDWFFVYESSIGLPNIIEFKLPRTDSAAYAFERYLQNRWFLSQGIDSTLRKFKGVGPLMDSIEISYIDVDDYYITYRMKCTNAINEYVAKKRESYRSIINEAVQKADKYASHNFYSKAYSILDSCRGIYKPMDVTLANKRSEIKRKHIEHHREELEYQVNQNRNHKRGIALCDSILSLDGGDSVTARIRSILAMRSDNQFQRYSDFAPEEYQKIVELLQHSVNREVNKNRNSFRQNLTLDFTFELDSTNHSSGKMHLEVEKRLFGSGKRSIEGRNWLMKRYIDSIANLPMIKPIYINGINIDIYQQLNAQIQWVSTEAICDEEQFQVGMDVYMNKIANDYFMKLNPKTNRQQVSKPTKYEYTFNITDKYLNGDSVGADILLTDFKTSNALSWMPSLLVPGLGTEIQGARDAAWSRAFPFYLFGIISAAGFYIESKDFSNSTSGLGKLLNDSGYLGKILAYGGLTIAGSIYVTDLVQAINATVKNLSRSKKLRKRLSEGPIEMKTTEIRLK